MKQRIAFQKWHGGRRRAAATLAFGATLALVSVVLIDGAIGQFGGPFGGGRRWMNGADQFDSEPPTDAFLPVDREVTRQWEKAKSLVEQGNFSDAATLLDEILERGEDYFFKPDASKSTYRSLKTEAERLVGNLPIEGAQGVRIAIRCAGTTVIECSGAGRRYPSAPGNRPAILSHASRLSGHVIVRAISTGSRSTFGGGAMFGAIRRYTHRGQYV